MRRITAASLRHDQMQHDKRQEKIRRFNLAKTHIRHNTWAASIYVLFERLERQTPYTDNCFVCFSHFFFFLYFVGFSYHFDVLSSFNSIRRQNNNAQSSSINYISALSQPRITSHTRWRRIAQFTNANHRRRRRRTARIESERKIF